MLRRLFLTLTLAFLFGLGQQGAAMHAISHYADVQEHQDKQTHSTAACEQCVVYANLVGAIPSSTFILPPHTGAHVAVATHTVAAESFYLLAYSARAPPFFS